MKNILRSKTLGLIGCGNMGTAILEGLFKKRMIRPRQVLVSDVDRAKARAVSKKFRVRALQSNADLSRRADILILAVKPQDLFLAAGEIRSGIASSKNQKNKTLITILAGTPIQKIKRLLGGRVSLIRAMPNLGAQVGEAMTAIAGSGRAHLQCAEMIFSACGKAIRLPEKYFDAVTALSGSGPAYFFLIMELLAGFGRRSGLSQKNAELMAVQTALGAALLARRSKESPGVLRRKVTSKKGTTEAALSFLSKKGFEQLFGQAVGRAAKRSRQLSKE